jgi:hypothetical protein
MTAEWRSYAERVDRACATNFIAGQIELGGLDARVRQEELSENEAEAEYRFIQSRHQQDTYDEIAAFGPPPAKAELLEEWLANVGRRAELMRKTGEAWLEDDRRLTLVRSLKITALKIDADWLGLHFGLRICTSNGPMQNRREDEDYLAELNAICRERLERDAASWRQGEFTPNAAAESSTGETLKMAAIAPPIEQYELRREILDIKRSTDRYQVRSIKRAARSPDPRAWLRLRDSVSQRIQRGRDQLAELGLADCAWPEPWQ